MTEIETNGYVPFRRLLRKTRRDQEHSQQHVSVLVGIRQATLSRFEMGTLVPNDEAVQRKLARYLGIPVAELRSLLDRDALEAERLALRERLGLVEARLEAYEIAGR
jgi:transcriptional regulator with XRE-family HTH domain